MCSIRACSRGEDEGLVMQVAQPVKWANELQQNQRVAVRREHVAEIRFHDEEAY